MSKTGAAFSVRFLRNGDQVSIVRNIINKDGLGKALFQVVDPTSGVVSPDWTDASEQPIIQLSVRSSAGYPSQIKSVVWAYNGTELKFTLNANNWVTARNDNRFMARINGTYYELKIVANLASKTEVANKQISYNVEYVSNGYSDTIQGSADVLIQISGSDSHIVQITTDRVELDADNPTATLTAVSMYGTENVAVGSNGYTLKWYQDGVEISGQTSAVLNVTRDMVTGGSLFIVKLFLNGNAVAQDSQRISDIADEYQIQYTPTDAGSNYVGVGHNASYILSMTKNGVTYAGTVNYVWEIYNSIGVNTGSGTGSSVIVKPENAIVSLRDSSGNVTGEYYSDCDVQVTATF